MLAEEAERDFDPGVSGNICGRIVAHRTSATSFQLKLSGTETNKEHPFCGQIQAGTEARRF
jgi:hypothetical protein